MATTSYSVINSGAIEHHTNKKQPPSYQDSAAALEPMTPLGFPQTLKAYNHLNLEGINTFFLCHESKENRLYAVTTQHTHRGKAAALGARPGILLHSGPTKIHSVIAAAGDELLPHKLISEYEYITGGPHSDIILVDHTNPKDSKNMTTDVMRARVTEDGYAAFTFHVKVGNNPGMHIEQFSWIEVPKRTAGFKRGGFKLVRHSLEEQLTLMSNHYVFPPISSTKNEEILARFVYSKRHQWRLARKVFTFEFTNEATPCAFGEQWKIIAVITATRLYQLKFTGRATRGGIESAQAFRRLQLCV
ncbi:hypothetical protein E0Z10_g5156 [Xylaria hypoxylon]|uniref:Uncharacterized protein n=1 Tax=Xylaria hypoxylon TaxID=37992 RepID=A0A4Z0YJG0_9PEZI|nr:hypothetical protein E0Z10_g5156 [Xylaria hypoxylon]